VPIRFRYAPEILERFPSIVGGVIWARSVRNGPTSDRLREDLAAEAARVRASLGDTPLSEVASLAAWRRAFRAFGVDPTQYRSAAEALLRRLTKGAELPTINAIADLANLVSIRWALPVAAFDQRAVAGGTMVRFANGDEPWTDLGGSMAEHPKPGEVIFVDDRGEVSARRWCWRQSAASAVRDDTSQILVTVEGHHVGASRDVAGALSDLEALLIAHAGALGLQARVLGADRPVFETAAG
jgi:DNA/RNA-binding domain of Phe-tRNA-synthetase-like protein